MLLSCLWINHFYQKNPYSTQYAISIKVKDQSSNRGHILHGEVLMRHAQLNTFMMSLLFSAI